MRKVKVTSMTKSLLKQLIYLKGVCRTAKVAPQNLKICDRYTKMALTSTNVQLKGSRAVFYPSLHLRPRQKLYLAKKIESTCAKALFSSKEAR
jgi:hypothetical protein